MSRLGDESPPQLACMAFSIEKDTGFSDSRVIFLRCPLTYLISQLDVAGGTCTGRDGMVKAVLVVVISVDVLLWQGQ